MGGCTLGPTASSFLSQAVHIGAFDLRPIACCWLALTHLSLVFPTPIIISPSLLPACMSDQFWFVLNCIIQLSDDALSRRLVLIYCHFFLSHLLSCSSVLFLVRRHCFRDTWCVGLTLIYKHISYSWVCYLLGKVRMSDNIGIWLLEPPAIQLPMRIFFENFFGNFWRQLILPYLDICNTYIVSNSFLKYKSCISRSTFLYILPPWNLQISSLNLHLKLVKLILFFQSRMPH